MWKNYLVFAISLFVILAVVFVITIPSTLGFTKEQRTLHKTILHIVLILISLAGIIVYPRTKEYKTRRKKGVSTKKTLVTFILFLSKFEFDVIFYIIEML